jgi:SAM-dependent methyltransferase
MNSPLPIEFPESQDWLDCGWLDTLSSVRAPVDEINRQIVNCALLEKVASADANSRWIEIGAGDGKLRKWLPDWLRDQLIHTEPSAEYLRQFRRENVDAELVEASVYDLPFDDNSIDGILGLCVFDALHDLPAAVTELRRSLRPGGHVVHFLDLGLACLETIFLDIHEAGQIPVPNYLAEPSVKSVSFAEPALGENEILNDLAISSVDRFGQVVQYLESVGHGYSAPMRKWLNAWLDSSRSAARLFMDIVSHPGQRAQFMHMLIEVHQLTSAYPNLAMDAKSVSTISLFRKRLSTLFSAENGFRNASSEILVGRDWKSPWPNLPEQCRYFGRFAGQVVTQSTARPIPIGRVIFEQAGNSSTESILVESGILFFHAVAK